MRLFLADPGLSTSRGHHANTCRAVVAAFRAKGVDPVVLASSLVEPSIRQEFNATPAFHASPYDVSDGDPLAGWINMFMAVSTTTSLDFQRLNYIGEDDVVYLASGQAGHLLGAALWLASRSADERPMIVMDLTQEPGLDYIRDKDIFVPRDPRTDPRAILYRHAANHLSKLGTDRVRLATCDNLASQMFEELMGRPVAVLPFPLGADVEPRNRAGVPTVVIGVLGHQRSVKGYQFVPEIATALLLSRPQIRLLCHNSEPGFMADVQIAMHEIARRDSRIILDERVVNPAEWQQLLDATDLMLCPYNPAVYTVGNSAVAAEAIANGIPMVVPEYSTMHRWIEDHGGAGTTFEKQEVDAIVAATERALDNFDELANRAFAGAGQWARTHGPANYADAILRLARP